MIHLPFDDRLEAGRALAKELRARGIPSDPVVLAVARGGVPVGFEVADRLGLPLDVIAARKIRIPWQSELNIGSFAGGTAVLAVDVIKELKLSASEVREIVSWEEPDARQREKFYRSGSAALDVSGKAAIIVDDGLASGNTALAAIRHLRGLKPGRTILAIPVASRDGYNRARKEADETICLNIPERFYAIGESYREFPQVTDLAVKTILAQNKANLLRRHSFSSIA